MELKNFFAQDLQGNVIPSPTVYLYQPSTTTLATGLKDADGAALTNPFTGTANGQVTVAAPDGDYDMRVTGAGRDTTMRVRFLDAVTYSAEILRDDLAATGGSDMVEYDGGTVLDALDQRLPELANYAALDAYAGPVNIGFYVRGCANVFDGGHGIFRPTTDTPAAANGIYRQDAIGRWWKREFSGAVNVKWFGALGDGSNQYTQIAAAWNYCLDNGKDLYFPDGIYSSGANNMPFKNPAYPATTLLDCKNITIYGDGPNTILRSDSVNGADVINLYYVKNLHFRNLAVKASISGSASGSNGISIVGGFDGLTFDHIWGENLPYVDKASYLDGGKFFTIQPGTPAAECGTVKGRNLFAKGCVYGVGLEIDLVNWSSKKHAIDLDIVVEDCFIGVIFSAGAASGAISQAATMGYKVTGRLINCQRNVVVGRAHGVDIEANIITTKSAAARRLNPSGGTWNSVDSVIDGLSATYAKNSRFVMCGDLGACDYKAQIGGATAGSSGQGAYSDNCQIYIDLGGTAAIANINAVNSGGNYIINSVLYVSASTASTIPTLFYTPSYNNTITLGPSVRLASLAVSGSLNFPNSDGVTSYTKLERDSAGYAVYAQQTGSSGVSAEVLGAKNHSGTKVFFVRNDGCLALSGRLTAASVATVKNVMPVYDAGNVLVGYVPIYTTYA